MDPYMNQIYNIIYVTYYVTFNSPYPCLSLHQGAKSAVMAVDLAVDAKPQSVDATTRPGWPAART